MVSFLSGGVEFLSDKYACDRLVELLATLRGPNGCPWDKEQTHESLRRYMLEEAYETVEAIDNRDFEHLKEELGDLLLQIVFHAQIASEKGRFNMRDVSEGIVTKLTRRHPHIFGECEVSSAKEVLLNWDEIKSREKKEAPQSALQGIPKSMPALIYAYKLQSKAAKVGFDWEDVAGALEKIIEEAAELKEAREEAKANEARFSAVKIEEELGDLLFAVVNVARHFDLDPEVALKKTCRKFERRFSYIEEKSKQQQKTLGSMTLQEMDLLWDEAKRQEK